MNRINTFLSNLFQHKRIKSIFTGNACLLRTDKELPATISTVYLIYSPQIAEVTLCELINPEINSN